MLVPLHKKEDGVSREYGFDIVLAIAPLISGQWAPTYALTHDERYNLCHSMSYSMSLLVFFFFSFGTI